ncbi:GTPase family protein [Actinoplanes sp. HUAS TT8]|uniref:GTPase family protein n=1 Tax=Actinoplanes sp. HUAS TT8 TaxID=3447453 RepID=UPI003F527966
MSTHVPTIGVLGVSGTGKSSTLNALFGADLPVSHSTAGTHQFRYLELAGLTVLDAPGLGEDAHRDPGYLREYATHLPRCDVLLWVLTARGRGLALDQSYLDVLRPPRDHLVFGVNQVDLIAPGDWETGPNLPSERQEQHLLEIVEDRRARLPGPVVGYSALRAYRLQELFTALVAACPPGRATALRTAKNLRPTTAARLAAEHRRERTHLRRERIHGWFGGSAPDTSAGQHQRTRNDSTPATS